METQKHDRMSAALLVLRVAASVPFFYHGSEILFSAFHGPGPAQFAAAHHWPVIVGYLVGIAEVCGALAVLTGWLFRLGAACIVIVMLGAISIVHLRNGYSVLDGGVEYPLTLLLLAVALLLIGPGAYTVKQRIRN